MVIKILVVVAVLIVALVVIVALQPSEFRVMRSATVSASPAAVFAQVNDFHKWEAWNPWVKIDPAMKQTYQGAPSGNTAEFTFKPEGNQTDVTWSMSGDKNFMAKAIHLFMNMDKIIGGQFEKGLASMKSIVEAGSEQQRGQV